MSGRILPNLFMPFIFPYPATFHHTLSAISDLTVSYHTWPIFTHYVFTSEVPYFTRSLHILQYLAISDWTLPYLSILYIHCMSFHVFHIFCFLRYLSPVHVLPHLALYLTVSHSLTTTFFIFSNHLWRHVTCTPFCRSLAAKGLVELSKLRVNYAHGGTSTREMPTLQCRRLLLRRLGWVRL